MKLGLRWFLLIFFALSSSAFANNDIYAFSDAVQAKQFATLTAELRCLVCQNESLADSTATLANDLRKTIYQQVKLGQTNAEIKHYLVKRYGDFVLFRPPVKKVTWVLWFAPLILLVLGLLTLLIKLKGRD